MRSWDRLLTYLFFSTHPYGLHNLVAQLLQRRPRFRASRSYDHIWWRRQFLATPREVTRPKILMLYDQEVWKPRGIISVISCCRNRCPFASQMFVVVRSLSTSKLINLCTAKFITTAHYISKFFILLSSFYNNKPVYSTRRSCDWKSLISILKCPARAWTSIPLEPAARSTPAYLTSKILLGIQQCAILNCSLWPFRLYNIFIGYLIYVMIFERKEVIEYKMCFSFFSTTCLKYFSL
jgi:hypothetical protein